MKALTLSLAQACFYHLQHAVLEDPILIQKAREEEAKARGFFGRLKWNHTAADDRKHINAGTWW